MKGTAASCALALQSTLDNSLGVTYSYTEDGSLGRTAKAPATPLLSELNNMTQLEATTTTWQRVRSRPAGDPGKDCATLTHFLHADRIDEIRFGLMVPDGLYERLEHMVEEIRFWVEDTVQHFAPIASVILDSSTVAYYVRHTKIRLRARREARGRGCSATWSWERSRRRTGSCWPGSSTRALCSWTGAMRWPTAWAGARPGPCTAA